MDSWGDSGFFYKGKCFGIRIVHNRYRANGAFLFIDANGVKLVHAIGWLGDLHYSWPCFVDGFAGNLPGVVYKVDMMGIVRIGCIGSQRSSLFIILRYKGQLESGFLPSRIWSRTVLFRA